MQRTVIRNAIVVTMDPKLGEFRSADVLIDGGKIGAVQPNLGPVEAHEIDGRGFIVIPGFVDTHRHTWQCLLRNSATDWSLPQYFGGVRGVMGDLYSPEDMYVANYIGALEALDGGVTTLVDWSHNNNSPEHADGAVKGLMHSGIRGVFAYGNANKEWFPVSALPTNMADVERVRKQYFNGDDGLCTMAFAPRGPQFATLELTEQEFRKARELDLPITVHVGDGLWGMGKPIDQLNALGLLGPKTTYVHGNTLHDHEYKLIADTGGSASIAPEVELNMGHGNLATLKFLHAGVRPSISIDVCTSVGGDMFGQMRVLLAATRAVVNAQALIDKKLVEAAPVTARDVLDFATLSGARAANLDHKVGSITVGKDADLVMLSTDQLNMFPINNAVNAVVGDAHPGNVDTVFVRGRAVKRHGKLVDVDVRALRHRMERAVDGLLARAGLSREENWLPKPYTGGTDV